MKSKPFQFTLARLLLATASMACACAITGWLYRQFQSQDFPSDIEAYASVLSFVAIGGFIGAAIGVIRGKVVQSVVFGLLIGFLLLCMPAPVDYLSPAACILGLPFAIAAVVAFAGALYEALQMDADND